MIDPDDQLELPDDVRFEGDAIHDLALNEAYPLRGTAMQGMTLLTSGLSIRESSNHLAKEFGVSAAQVLVDLLGFVGQLNRAQLVNVRSRKWRVRIRRCLQVLLFLALAHRWPSQRVRRYAIPGGIVSIVRQVTTVVAVRMAPIWLVLFVPVVLPTLLLSPALAVSVAALPIGLVAAIIVHETVHAVAARALNIGSYLIRSGWRVAVVHREQRGTALVTAAGPALSGLVGLAILLLATATASLFLALLAVPFTVQILALTVFGKDGRLLLAHMESAQ
jgi:hypothetical protein